MGKSTNRVDPTKIAVPAPHDYVNGDVLINTAAELFGTVALTSTARVVHGAYQRATVSLLQRLWERHGRQLSKSLRNLPDDLAKCQKELDRE